MEIDLVPPVAAVGKSTCKRAHAHAKSIPLIINMDQDIVGTATVEHFTGTVSRYPFSPFVPIDYLPIPINKINTYVDVVKNIPIELFT
jgi:hypothetical protein